MDMRGNVAKEHGSGSSQPTGVDLDQKSTSKNNNADMWDDDGSLWEGDNELDKSSDLQREWQKRRNEFHTIGYRDGLMAGKEASAQEGFNDGFNKSVFAGYDWGLVRGVTSALSCLPDRLKERLVETQETKNNFLRLYESVNAISTSDALKLFHDEILNKLGGKHVNVEPNLLRIHSDELRVLLHECPSFKIHFQIDKEKKDGMSNA